MAQKIEIFVFIFLIIQLIQGCPNCVSNPDCVPYTTNADVINTTILYSAKEKGAVCLDGSPPAYHFAPGCENGANNWMIFLEGGAWCSSNETCYDKIKPSSPGCGSSSCKGPIAFFSGILNGSDLSNPDFYNWNRVFVRYCDGSSFSGDIEETILFNGTVIYRRGARIFDAIMEALIPMGMGNATNALLGGTSAGGLGAILHCDRFKNYLPFAARLKCISGGGFFIHGKDLPQPELREQFYGDIVTYHGMAKFLPRSCTLTMDPRLCIFPENLVGQIETPLFLLNSAFDKYQIQNHLEPVDPGWENCTSDLTQCNVTQIQTMKDFRTAFVQALPQSTPSDSRGMYIDSCYIHSEIMATIPWERFAINNKTMVTAVGDWYFDRSSVHEIDLAHNSPLNCI